MCKSKDDIENFVNATLLASELDMTYKYDNTIDDILSKDQTAIQKTKTRNDSLNPILNCMEFLIEHEFIRTQLNEQTNEINYVPTRLGQACLGMLLKDNKYFFFIFLVE